MPYQIIYKDEYLGDIKRHKKNGNKKLVKKAEKLDEEIAQHPRTGTGQVERLKHYGDAEVYSRRIDREHRLVYEILEDNTIVILMAAFGHYN